MDNIAVSVVVAVYNRENLLDRCIDSLAYQTLDNIEIILVDDQSQDASMEVMRRWKRIFPEKIIILSNLVKGVANAKNLGIRHARGEYIAFVDSDDYVDYRMLARLYQHAQKNNWPKLIHSPIWSVSGQKKWRRSTMTASETIEDFLKLETFFLPGKLFQRELFDQFGMLPELGIGEDVSWVFPVMSYLDKISYCNQAGYFYELSDNSISAQKTEEWVIHDILKGSERIIQKTNPQYREFALIYAFRRIISLSKNKPLFQDLFTDYLLKNCTLLDEVENLEMKAPDLVHAMTVLRGETHSIPRTAYINGFGEYGETEVRENYQKALGEGVDIVVLNETSCDIASAPVLVAEAWQQGNAEFVGKYFALQECYKNGGIYIDKTVDVDRPFVQLLKDPAFFGFESDAAFSDRVFGACPQNPVIEKILKTYEMPELYESPFIPLRERIKTILIGMGNIQMSSSTIRREAYGFCVYPVDMFVFSLHYSEDSCVCHYKDGTFPEEPYINIPARVLKALVDHHTRIEVDKVKKEVVKAKQETQKERNLSAKRNRRIQTLEKQIADIKNSRSWKITKPLRWLIRRLGLK